MLSCHWICEGKALLSACKILNRIHSKFIKVFLYKLWNEKKLNIIYFKVWGYLVHCKNTDYKKIKLGLRCTKFAFLGYANNIKSYRLLNLEINVIIESNDVEFFENSLFLNNELKGTHKDKDFMIRRNWFSTYFTLLNIGKWEEYCKNNIFRPTSGNLSRRYRFSW